MRKRGGSTKTKIKMFSRSYQKVSKFCRIIDKICVPQSGGSICGSGCFTTYIHINIYKYIYVYIHCNLKAPKMVKCVKKRFPWYIRHPNFSWVFILGCRIIRSTLVGGAVNKLPDNATPGTSGWRVRHSSFFVIFRDFPFCVLPLRRNRLTFFLDSTCFWTSRASLARCLRRCLRVCA